MAMSVKFMSNCDLITAMLCEKFSTKTILKISCITSNFRNFMTLYSFTELKNLAIKVNLK